MEDGENPQVEGRPERVRDSFGWAGHDRHEQTGEDEPELLVGGLVEEPPDYQEFTS